MNIRTLFKGRRKWFALLPLLAIGLVLGLTACGATSGQAPPPSGNQAESSEQTQDTNNILNNQPLPNIKWSQWRQDLIGVEEAESNDVATTSFVMSYANQNPIFSCPSIGFPIPVTASLSNPQQAQWNSGGSNGNYGVAGVPVGQMDPNGVYMPPSGAGTWVVCTDGSGAPYITYAEDNVDAVGGPAVWNDSSHSYSLVGAPTAGVQTAPAGTNATTGVPANNAHTVMPSPPKPAPAKKSS